MKRRKWKQERNGDPPNFSCEPKQNISFLQITIRHHRFIFTYLLFIVMKIDDKELDNTYLLDYVDDVHTVHLESW